MICESREVHLDALDAGALHLVDGVIRGQCFHGVQCSMTTMEDEGREKPGGGRVRETMNCTEMVRDPMETEV